MFSPSIVALVADAYSLAVGMMMSPIILVLAAIVWYYLPETLSESDTRN